MRIGIFINEITVTISSVQTQKGGCFYQTAAFYTKFRPFIYFDIFLNNATRTTDTQSKALRRPKSPASLYTKNLTHTREIFEVSKGPSVQPQPQEQDRYAEAAQNGKDARKIRKVSRTDQGALFLARRLIFFLDFFPAVGVIPGHPLDIHVRDGPAVVPFGKFFVTLHAGAPADRGGRRTDDRSRNR